MPKEQMRISLHSLALQVIGNYSVISLMDNFILNGTSRGRTMFNLKELFSYSSKLASFEGTISGAGGALCHMG